MTPERFLGLLAPHRSAPLVFDTGRGLVPGGYHVTEVKAVQVRAMDCGGRATAWNETVVQVWPPVRPAAASMSVSKFLSIYERVGAAVGIDPNSHLRVEYAAAGEAALAYLVDDVTFEDEVVRVRLSPPAVACKGGDRSVGDLPVLSVPAPAGDGSGPCGPVDPAASLPSEPTRGTCCGDGSL